jgi:hypothetical protein
MRREVIRGSAVTMMAVVAAVPLWSALPAAADNGQSVYLAANGKAGSSAAVQPATAPISRDSSLSLSGLSWTSWGDRAAGSGVATVNLCDPDCATGKSVTTPVTVALSNPQSVCGRDFYTEMQLTFTGAVPDGLPHTTSVPVAPFC